MTIPEVLAHLDVFERDLMAMAMKVREYRHTLFASYTAESLDSTPETLLD